MPAASINQPDFVSRGEICAQQVPDHLAVGACRQQPLCTEESGSQRNRDALQHSQSIPSRRLEFCPPAVAHVRRAATHGEAKPFCAREVLVRYCIVADEVYSTACVNNSQRYVCRSEA